VRRAAAIALTLVAAATAPRGAQRALPATLAAPRGARSTPSTRAELDSAMRSTRDATVTRGFIGAIYGGAAGVFPGAYAGVFLGGLYDASLGQSGPSWRENMMIGAAIGALGGGVLGARLAANSSCSTGTRIGHGILAVLGSASVGVFAGTKLSKNAGVVVALGSLALAANVFGGCG